MSGPRFATTQDLISSFPTAAAFLREDGSPEESLRFIDRCLADDRIDVAITYCAFLLPRREAVWWGCVCMADVEALNDRERTCVGLARDWALHPDEAKRRRALERGLESSGRQSGTWMALAAGRSGGNVGAAGADPVAADPAATAQAVRAALLSAATRVAAERRKAIMNRWVALVLSYIADGIDFR